MESRPLEPRRSDRQNVVKGKSMSHNHQEWFGKTPDGTTFVVPKTNAMLSQLLDPRQTHNLFDGVVIASVALLIAVLYAVPRSARQPLSAVIFLFWRGCYNLGIGWLLYHQSKSRLLISWARKSQIFNYSKHYHRPSFFQRLIRNELEKEIPKDYTFDQSPIEYNTWLVFRRFVDVVLMCDFSSYCLFAFEHSVHPESEVLVITAGRYIIGICLIAFNVWVKYDAHRVVKDYAWYWGDFFYLTNCELTFDGVFEIIPHPMYSAGYAGYYGISIIAASYRVLLISIIAHASQFAFLFYVENPHIEKTYPTPTCTQCVNGNINVWDLA